MQLRGPVKAVRRSQNKFDVLTTTKVYKFKVQEVKAEFGELQAQKEVDEWVKVINKAIQEQNKGPVKV